jgi:hypothetical protein
LILTLDKGLLLEYLRSISTGTRSQQTEMACGFAGTWVLADSLTGTEGVFSDPTTQLLILALFMTIAMLHAE